MESYYVFRLLSEVHGIYCLAIVRRAFDYANTPAVTVYIGAETMPTIQNMARSLCIRGEPIFIQFGNHKVEHATKVFPTLLDDRYNNVPFLSL